MCVCVYVCVYLLIHVSILMVNNCVSDLHHMVGTVLWVQTIDDYILDAARKSAFEKGRSPSPGLPQLSKSKT